MNCNQKSSPKLFSFTVHEQMSIRRARKILENKKIRVTSGHRQQETSLRLKLPRAIWFIVCCIGLFAHSWLTTVDYLEYRTTTGVEVYAPIQFRPPAVSLCASLNDLINVSKLNTADEKYWHDYNCSYGLLPGCLYILREYRIDMIMNNLTYGILTEVYGYDGIIYSKRLKKCVKYVKYNTGLIDVGDIDLMETSGSDIITISLPMHFNEILKDTDHSLNLGVAIHDSRTLEHIRENNMIWIPVDQYNYHMGTFDHVESKFLPAPFTTKCIHYRSTKYESMGDCIEYCFEKEYKTRYGKNFGLITTSNFSEAVLPSYINLTYDKSIDKSCYRKCPGQCELLSYFSIRTSDFIFSDITHIFNYAITLSRPFIKVTLMASFDLNSFVIFMASAAGMWLGCSLYVSMCEFVNNIAEIIN